MNVGRTTRRNFIHQSGAMVLTAAAVPVAMQQMTKPPAGTQSDEFLARLPQMLELANVPGLSAAIVKDGKLAWSRGFGLRNAKEQNAVDADTIFQCGSLSKPVCAYALLKMREEKLIDLDRPLVSYLNATDLPDDPRTKLITARHALSHSTGWQNWRFQKGQSLLFAFNPGEKFQYSGEGFFLLQRVIEQISNRSFEEVMQERVMKPLGMTHSSYVRQPHHETNIAMGHNSRGNPGEFGSAEGRQKMLDLAKEWNKPLPSWRYEDTLKAVQQLAPEMPVLPNFLSPNAAGSLLTTAPDYARFLIRLLDNAPKDEASLSETTRREMLTPQIKINSAISWGLGIGLESEQGRTGCWHWGDNENYKAFVFGDPVNRSGVVVLTNGANGHKLWQRVVAQATGRDHASFLFWMA